MKNTHLMTNHRLLSELHSRGFFETEISNSGGIRFKINTNTNAYAYIENNTPFEETKICPDYYVTSTFFCGKNFVTLQCWDAITALNWLINAAQHII